MPSFTKKEETLIEKINTPAKVQDFLNSLRFNFEKSGETLLSPLFSLKFLIRKTYYFVACSDSPGLKT